MSEQARHVHKFGGSSLADASCFRRVTQIIERYSVAGDLIVVSAAGKTTNRLLELLDLASNADPAAVDVLESLLSYQLELVSQLLNEELAAKLTAALQQDQIQITHYLEQQLDRWTCNEILSFGERWSARLLSALLQQQHLLADWIDSRDFLRAPDGAQPQVDFACSQPLLQQLLAAYPADARLVITGFIAREPGGHTITLGRNGSDYSATELAALSDAAATTIWSDVAGIYSADPRKVRSAKLLTKLSHAEASELSRIGASVLHARSLEPLSRSKQRLMLRCSYTPDDGMTQIVRQRCEGPGARIVSALDNVYLIDIDFDGQETVLNQLLCYLDEQQLKPLTWQQRRDCDTIRLAYTAELYPQALQSIEQWAAPRQCPVQGQGGFCLLALVGRGVSEHAEHSSQFYRLLARQPISFIQHGPAHLSLIAVLPQITLDPLVKELHQALFDAPRQIGVVVFGKGNIGSLWLSLFARERSELEQRFHQRLILAGLFGRTGGMLNMQGLDPVSILDHFTPHPLIWQELLDQLRHHPFDELVVVDMTASETVSRYYPQLARHGIHVITANKYAGSAELSFYQQTCQLFHEYGGHWLYNATVGAGLPVQSSIQMLRDSGDKIREISGIFSGTLSWLFQQYDGRKPFSQLLHEAWQQGLTEPDPREDLSGQDVQRKLLILAREAGFALEQQQIELQSLIPESLAELPLDEFWQRSSELDAPMLQQLEQASHSHQFIRYLARFNEQGQAQIGLIALDAEHPFVHLRPCDNVFAITSDWYQSNPLVIQGPGAGREVTAGAIQSDLVQLCQRLV
ncbi:bifunctional aspartate kinase/homoserine dehydrogenase II [Celerinatantimonas sp. YJH-8]|uniref:bifunctional aspartate kinase/homoserine dehydrogenase II n=1 Tax=Celerinatantimonas sp. YJH-8 TaxID=3228714 RepID=UPI0038C02D58